MLRRILLIGIILNFYYINNAQILYGANQYISYRVGSLPIIISVPHDGIIKPSNIPDRTCNNPTTVRDVYVYDLALQLDSSFMRYTGCRPHLITCHLNRTKLDANRNKSDAACGNKDAELAWSEYHQFIDTAIELSKLKWQDDGFYIDLHGHGHPIQRLEIGYILTREEISARDSLINTNTYINKSSIRNLAKENKLNLTHAELLRDKLSLGSLFAKRGFPAVPSNVDPRPDTTDYFNGGYNTAIHTCANPNVAINGCQIETNYQLVRDTYTNRKKCADSMALSILEFLELHQGLQWRDCKLINQNNEKTHSIIDIYFDEYNRLIVDRNCLLKDKIENIKLYDFNGKVIYSNNAILEHEIKLSRQLPIGLYLCELKIRGKSLWIKLVKN